VDTLQQYVDAKAVVTVLDGDDWRWIYVGKDLVYEGHGHLNSNVIDALLDAILGKGNWILQDEWVGAELAQDMCGNAPKLPDIQEKFGHEPDDILIYW
jgi:hypothetical protein